jgi:predicted PurR-regulated permease PerM
MSAHDHPTDTALRRTNERSEGAAPVRVRLTAPPLSGVLRVVLLLVATALGLYLVWRIRGVIQLLAISLFFAFALFPVVDAVAERTRAPRAVVILVVYVILALLVGLIGYVVIPSVVREVQTLSRDAPHYAAELRRSATFRHYDDHYHITAKLLRDAQRLPELLARAAGPLKDVTVGAASFVTQLITVLAVAFCSSCTDGSTPSSGCPSSAAGTSATAR